MFRLHFNKSIKMFTVRRQDRSIVCASERRAKLPILGSTIPLAPSVHIIITRGDFQKAIDKQRPVLSVAVTRFPFVRLLIERIKEVF
ncbi:hypothetical protein TARRARE_7 [Escherichia phage vB_Ec_Tarrare]|uniref:Uncharacterized protein n=1 Tax=Escherichia phage vB_Ec_Tarrare TaxID=3032379 RepID=A0AAF0D4E0_9CAUD|nr:hypothetical protein TARRARE_7 [Escherichia phage vB_Ec_Tarrare]